MIDQSTGQRLDRAEQAAMFQALLENPYEVYRASLASGQPLWHEAEPDVHSKGVWLFARHADAIAVLTSKHGLSKNLRAVRPEGLEQIWDLFMLNRDGAAHLHLRRLVAAFFSAQRIQALEPRVAQLVEDLLAKLPREGPVDLIHHFAEPLPLHVISELVGVSKDDIWDIRAWTLSIVQGMDAACADWPGVVAAKREAMRDFGWYVRAVVAEKRKAPGDDLITHLLQATGDQAISEDEQLVTVMFMLFAGHETTVNLIGNGLWLLMTHPEQRLRLCAQPMLAAGAVEEVLRFESPTQRLSFRVANVPLTIGTQAVQPGEQVNVLLGAANRDPAVFDRPDEFDITRSPNPHLSFGFGLHNCLGKALARLEGRVALGRMAGFLANWTLVSGPPQWRANSAFRGLERLEVVRRNPMASDAS